MKVYISNMDKKPEHCADCPICNENDDCDLVPMWFETWEEQYGHCPLQEVDDELV